MLQHDTLATAVSDRLYLEVPAKPEQVGNVRRQVADFTRRQSWKDLDADDLLLAVGEACNNAVSYGGKNEADPRLVIYCQRLASGHLQVDVCNQGNGFHPELDLIGALPDDQFATHGRGFGLMLALVDSVQVLSDSRHTTVRLTKSPSA